VSASCWAPAAPFFFLLFLHHYKKIAGEGGVSAEVQTAGYAVATAGYAAPEQMGTPLDAAQAELEEAGKDQRERDRLIAIEQKKLDDLADERKNKGRGRPSTSHAAKVKAAQSKIAKLQRGWLPGQSAPSVPRTTDELVGSAAQHPQHHAAAGSVPVGRPPNPKRARAEQDGDADGYCSDGDGDDGEEVAEFKQFYGVSVAQKAFNEETLQAYMKHDLLRAEIKVEPDNLIASGCKAELMGLGAVHICAPQLHMWLPLTPCPRHGWHAVDSGKVSYP